MKIKNILIAAVALVASQTAVASPNLIVNGGFESSTFSGPFTTYSAGSTSLSGWTIKTGSIDLINTYWQNASGSNYSIDLSGNEDGVISQELNTTVNQTYSVSFSLAGNPDDPDVNEKIKFLQVGLSNGPFYTFDTTGQTKTNMGWVTKSFEFIATDTTSKLFFASAQDSAFGPALDNVSVTAVPEPETYAMFLAGITLMAGIARRRNNLLK